jgi:hypothetical protein
LKPALPITDVLIDFLGPRPETDRAPPIDAIRSRATAIYAYQRDLNVIIPREAVGSYDRDHEAMSLRYMDGKIVSVVTLHALKSRIIDSKMRS